MEGSTQTQQNVGPDGLPVINDDFFAKEDQALEDEFQNAFVNGQEAEQQAQSQQAQADPKKNEEGANDGDEEFKFDESLAEAEAKELEEINSRFNTDYKTLKEFNDTVQKKDTSVSEEERTYQDNTQVIEDLNSYIAMDSKTLMREKLLVTAQQNGKDVKSPEVIEEVELSLEKWEDNDTLDLRADSLKAELRGQIKEKTLYNQNYQEKKNSLQQQKEEERKKSVNQAVTTAFKEHKDEFFGVKTTKQDYVDALKNINNNKLINHIKNNPRDAVDLELFLKYRNVISKKTGGPTYSDGVKDTYNELNGRKGASTQNATGGSESQLSNAGGSSLVDDFVK